MPKPPGSPTAAAAADAEAAARLKVLSSQEAYDAFLSAALAVEESALQPCNADAVLTHAAVKRGVEEVLGHESELVQLPDVDVEELRSLPRLVQGLAFAIRQHKRSLSAKGKAGSGSALPSPSEAAGLRDRFWTLVLQRHEVLWRCGAWIYGHEVDSHVPAIQTGRSWDRLVKQQAEASSLSPSPSQPERRERFTIRIGPSLPRL